MEICLESYFIPPLESVISETKCPRLYGLELRLFLALIGGGPPAGVGLVNWKAFGPEAIGGGALACGARCSSSGYLKPPFVQQR